MSCIHKIEAQGLVETAILIELFSLEDLLHYAAALFYENTELAGASIPFGIYVDAALAVLSE